MRKILFTLIIIMGCLRTYGQAAPEMAIVPGGSFDMGNNDGDPYEKPVHHVTISSFKLAKCGVTVAEFAAFVKATGYRTDAENGNWSFIFDHGPSEFSIAHGVNWRDDEEGHLRNESDWNMPVIHVSWNDAIAYCKWLSAVTGNVYRLPTEAEYEYAAGNGSRHTRYSWGNDLPCKGCEVANVADETTHPKYGSWKQKFSGYNDGYFFASPVGCYTANDFGLYDMTGNVWEWCNDWYDKDYYANSPATNPQGPAISHWHVFRGGSWHSKPVRCSITTRLSGQPDDCTPNLGFRVASSI